MEQGEPLLRRLRALLPVAERERAARFKRAGHEDRWIVARAALRILVCTRLGCIPEEVVIATGEHGKPFVPGAELRFNVSHSGTQALIALAHDVEVGVDIERPGRNVAAVERALSPGERASGDPLLQIWCRKEAWAKAMGGGLGWAPETFDTTQIDGYAVADLVLEDGYVGALAVAGTSAAHSLGRLSL